jgi:hypothetical protein
MTNDEQRKVCVSMVHGTLIGLGYNATLEEATDIFDAVYGLARICPIEATAEMLEAAQNYFGEGLTAYYAIAAAGDLTKPPEVKP